PGPRGFLGAVPAAPAIAVEHGEGLREEAGLASSGRDLCLGRRALAPTALAADAVMADVAPVPRFHQAVAGFAEDLGRRSAAGARGPPTAPRKVGRVSKHGEHVVTCSDCVARELRCSATAAVFQGHVVRDGEPSLRGLGEYVIVALACSAGDTE